MSRSTCGICTVYVRGALLYECVRGALGAGVWYSTESKGAFSSEKGSNFICVTLAGCVRETVGGGGAGLRDVGARRETEVRRRV